MSKRTINITGRSKLDEFKQKVTDTTTNVVNWCKENRTAAIGIGVTTLSFGTKALKAFARIHASNRDLRCWDASLGHHWVLKRKLSKKEWLKIDRRKANGERLGDILDDLGVLK